MRQCVQQHVLFVLFWRIIKRMMEFLYLKCLNRLCRRVCDCAVDPMMIISYVFFVEYAEKIPFVNEPMEEVELETIRTAEKMD